MENRFYISIRTEGAEFERQVSAKGNILCEMHVVVGGQPFPDDSWRDFPVIVLAWWLDGVLQIRDGASSVENSFMNGPFEFAVAALDDKITLSPRKRRVQGSEPVGNDVEMPAIEYRDEVVRAAEALIRELDMRSAGGKDLEYLRAITDQVRVG